jgi:hypothetical protein
MHIFIDESGTFAPVEGKHSVSLVAALVFSNHGRSKFEREYSSLRRRFPKENGEVKGRLLSEAQVRKVTRLLQRAGCLLEVIVMDAAFHTAEEVQFHKQVQAKKFTENITDEHHPNIHAAVGDLRSRLEALAPQLYLQSLAMSELIYSVLYHADIYFSFREPPELGDYHWTIDAKGRDRLTNWEDWWSQIIMPVTQSKTMREPLARVEEGDFSFQDQFKTEPSEYLLQFMDSTQTGEFFDLRPVLSDNFNFSSDAEPCLEAVDIIANATRRALSGNLKKFGWNEIPGLMIHRRGHYLRLITVAADDQAQPMLPYADVINAFRSGGRSMFPPE